MKSVRHLNESVRRLARLVSSSANVEVLSFLPTCCDWAYAQALAMRVDVSSQKLPLPLHRPKSSTLFTLCPDQARKLESFLIIQIRLSHRRSVDCSSRRGEPALGTAPALLQASLLRNLRSHSRFLRVLARDFYTLNSIHGSKQNALVHLSVILCSSESSDSNTLFNLLSRKSICAS